MNEPTREGQQGGTIQYQGDASVQSDPGCMRTAQYAVHEAASATCPKRATMELARQRWCSRAWQRVSVMPCRVEEV